MPLNLKETTVDWFVCNCGNDPSRDGFYTCLKSGRIVSPAINGEWDGVHYLCFSCDAVYDQDTLEQVGVADHPAVVAYNDQFNWEEY
jgi:hypothetical protein